MNRAVRDQNQRAQEGAPSSAKSEESSAARLNELLTPPQGHTILRLPAVATKDNVDRAKVSEHGPRLSPEQLRGLRNGFGSTLSGELLSEHCVRALNQQLHHHSFDEISRSLDRMRGPRQVIGQIYELVTQYGSIEQLYHLAEVVSERCAGATGPALYAPGDTSLGAVVRYLGVNKSILPVDWKIRSTSRIEPEVVVILDETVLARLRSDSTFVREIIEGQATLLSPLGFVRGVTPFRTPNLGEVEERVGSVIGQAEIHPDDPAEEVERKVVAVMRFEVLSDLYRIDPRLSERVEFIAARCAPGKNDVERISHQLNGRAGISAESFEMVLGQFDPRYRPVVKDLLVRHAHVHSHLSLGAAVREHGGLITQLARERNVAIEDIAFHCPEANKSFSMYGMIFRQGNPEFPSPSFTTPANLVRWLEARGERPRLVVFLDDFSGSGESLRRAVEATQTLAPGVMSDELVLSPLIATEVAVELLRGAAVTGACVVAPVQITPRIIEGVGYRSATREIQLAQRAALGVLGFAENGTMVSLPYMSPDNNAELFAQCFAEYFTLSVGAVRNYNGGLKVFAAKLQGPAFDVMQAQVMAKLRDARHVAGLLPTLKNLLESEQYVVRYWENLPQVVREDCEPEWIKTRNALREERAVAVYSQLNVIRDVVEATEVAPRDKLRFALDYKQLAAVALTVELPLEVRQAIEVCGRIPALQQILSSRVT